MTHLVLDIGNTKTALGCWHGENLIGSWRITGPVREQPAEFGVHLRGLLTAARAPLEHSDWTFASVVPRLSGVTREALQREFGQQALEVNARSGVPLRFDVDRPERVGPDRVVTAIAAHHRFRADVVVVDLGTASTFSCVTGSGLFVGGAIAPGIGTAAESLIRATALLPAVPLERPSAALGRNTEACMQSGVFWGAVDGVNGMIRRLKQEWSGTAIAVATGGLAPIIAPHCHEVAEIEPRLALQGLRLARVHPMEALP